MKKLFGIVNFYERLSDRTASGLLSAELTETGRRLIITAEVNAMK